MKKRGRFKFKLKTWQLLLLLVPLLFVDATLLRLYHIRMTELMTAVIKADEEGDEEKITQSLEELKKFVFSNVVINIVEENGVYRVAFGTGPFNLEYQYKRAANAALEEAEKNMTSDANPNGNIYAAASAICQPLAIANGWSWDNPNYVDCMVTEINKYPATNEIQDKIMANIPDTGLYRKNYASPIWAPTLTGFMLLLTLIVIVVIFIRVIIWVILRLSLLFI